MESKNLKLRKVISSLPKLSETSSPSDYKKTIHFNHQTLPEAKKWKIGDKKHLVLHVEHTGVDKSGSTFDIHRVGEFKKGDNYGQ